MANAATASEGARERGVYPIAARFSAVVVAVAGWTGCAGAPPTGIGEPPARSRFVFAESHLGTRVRIVVWAPDRTSAETAGRAAFARIAGLDQALSDYRPDSELSRLGRAPVGVPVSVSDDLWNVLIAADRWVRLSRGAFDPTLGPIVRLWRRARRLGELPTDARRTAALERIGWRHVTLDPDRQTVTLARDGMQFDLGGIAKGYIADRALATLEQFELPCALVDAGGDLAVGTAPPEAAGWSVGIAPLAEPNRPRTADPGHGGPNQPPSRTLTLADRGVATSGDAYRFVEIDGVRYSHLVDPRTGLGLTLASSVTVIAEDAMTADALASAISVLGPRIGLELIERTPNCEAEITTRAATAPVEQTRSAGFPSSQSKR